MDFDEWFKSHRYSDVPLCYGAAKDAFKSGQQSKQAEIRKAILSLRNEFNLWADDTEPFHAIEAQIEQIEELLK